MPDDKGLREQLAKALAIKAGFTQLVAHAMVWDIPREVFMELAADAWTSGQRAVTDGAAAISGQ